MNPSMDIELGNIIATTQYNSRAPKNLSGVTQYYMSITTFKKKIRTNSCDQYGRFE